MARSKRMTAQELAASFHLGESSTSDLQEAKTPSPRTPEDNEKDKMTDEARPASATKKPNARRQGTPKAEVKPKSAAPNRGKQAVKKVSQPADDLYEIAFPEPETERKTRKTNFAFRPSDYELWNRVAKDKGISVTILIETIMNEYCSRYK